MLRARNESFWLHMFLVSGRVKVKAPLFCVSWSLPVKCNMRRVSSSYVESLSQTPTAVEEYFHGRSEACFRKVLPLAFCNPAILHSRAGQWWQQCMCHVEGLVCKTVDNYRPPWNPGKEEAPNWLYNSKWSALSNIHKGNIIWTESVVFLYLRTIKETEVMKEHEEGKMLPK